MPPTHNGPRANARASSKNTPYLSVVVTARNDDHGGNLLGRMQIFADAWINQCKRHGLNSELIIVEWNPPADREPLLKALRWPADTSPCQVRIVEVPRQLHARYRHAAALPLYQMIAKNVGIRRARGEFILATNIDIVFSDELMQFLASHRLEKGRMYRIDRHDAATDVPINGTLDEQLAYCRGHLIRRCAREGTFSLTPDGIRQNPPDDITSAGSGLSFGDGWYQTQDYPSGERYRWIHNDAEIVARVPEGGAILLIEVEPGPGLGPLPQTLQVFDEHDSKVAEWTIGGRTTVALAVPAPPAGGAQSFRLRTPGGGSAVMIEQRILNLAVFRCDWVPRNAPKSQKPTALSAAQQNSLTLQRLLGALHRYQGTGALLAQAPRTLRRAVGVLRRRGDDIFEAGLDFQLGPGWSYLEESGGERFRWVSQDAQFAIRMPDATSKLALLVEPGPSQGHRPFVLLVQHPHDSGNVIARALVQGLTYLEFSVPATPGTITTLCLTPEGQGSPVGSDPRLLNFRVFACGAGSQRESSAPSVAPLALSKWPALTIDSGPVQKDWSTELEPWSAQLRAMGKPVFLHTNACGDFTLMAREHWYDLRGYAELDLFSMHLDSLLCYAAHHAGAREEVLREPMRIYHIEHEVGSGWTPEGQARLEARIARLGIQSVLHDDLAWLIAQMRSRHAPILFNLEDWGLVEHELAESSPAATLTAVGSEAGR
ncbi:MAG: hypothetical protein LAP38_12805 [Acidobacteriia bacterium]|nr:hypothetical protein [Terriglobia bacterium]